MTYEKLEEGKKLKNRAESLDRISHSVDIVKAVSRVFIEGNSNCIEINTIDPTGELKKTIFLLVEAKLNEEKQNVDAAFDKL